MELKDKSSHPFASNISFSRVIIFIRSCRDWVITGPIETNLSTEQEAGNEVEKCWYSNVSDRAVSTEFDTV